jgi:hypothetical protein
MAGVAGVCQLRPCVRVRLPTLGQRRTGILNGVLGKTYGGGALEQLLYITVETHSLGGGGGQHRGRRMGTWSRGLLLQNLPLESRAIPATETRLQRRRGRRKPEKGIEGGR